MWERLIRPLLNNRGQLALPSMQDTLSNYLSLVQQPTTSGSTNFSNTLTQYLPSISSFLSGNQTATGLPRTAEQLGGLGLLSYAMRPQEDITVPSIYDMRSPYGTSAVDYLQGLYQAPTDPFAPGGIYSKYLPQLQASETDLFNDIQQRLIAGQPGGLSTAMGGSEIGAIREGYLTRALPQRLALQADLMRDALTRQQSAANTVYGGEGNLQQLAFASEIEAALANARTESERNAILGSLGTALLLSGRGGAGTSGLPGTGTTGQPGLGGLGDAISRFLGGGTSGMGQYAPIGQMSVADILGQMQAGTLTTSQGLALIAKTQALPLLGTAAAGYGAGSLIGGAAGGATDSQLIGSGAGALSGAAAGALLGSTIFPGVGTAIGAILGGLTGLFGGFGETREGQHEIKEEFRQADLSAQADMVQEIGSFFTQRLSGLGVDTTAFQQFISQQIAMSESGASAYSFQGISGTADQQQAVGSIGGQLLLRALQQVNPSITSLTQVSGLRDEFIDYITANTENPANPGAEARPITYEEGLSYALPSGLAQGGTLPAGGEFLVGERGPELLRAAPGTQVLPFTRGADGSFSLDPTATARSVVPENIYIPDVSRSFEGMPTFPWQASFPGVPNVPQSPLSPGQALLAQFDPRTLTPGAIPEILAGLRTQGTFPGRQTPGVARPLNLGTTTAQRRPVYAGRPAFAGTRPPGSIGQSLLARALQAGRTQRSRRRNAPAYV